MELKNKSGAVLYKSEKAKTISELVLEAVEAAVDLTQANLPGADLQGIKSGEHKPFQMPEANLIGAQMSVVDIPYANLSNANLTQANLFGAKLRNANLSGANLSGANLIKADLTQANLEGANLIGANLASCILDGAKMDGVKK